MPLAARLTLLVTAFANFLILPMSRGRQSISANIARTRLASWRRLRYGISKDLLNTAPDSSVLRLWPLARLALCPWLDLEPADRVDVQRSVHSPNVIHRAVALIVSGVRAADKTNLNVARKYDTVSSRKVSAFKASSHLLAIPCYQKSANGVQRSCVSDLRMRVSRFTLNLRYLL